MIKYNKNVVLEEVAKKGQIIMLINDNQYLSIIKNIKAEIKNSQYKAIVSVNHELVMLYYTIGLIINKQKIWGNKFIENLSRDIKLEFPDLTGYSVRNLKYMAKFAAEYPDMEFVQQVVAQLPWGHNVVLLDKISDTIIRKWYIKKCVENGWSKEINFKELILK